MDYTQKLWFKFVYILLCDFLWILIGILVHWLMEWPVLYYLTKNFQIYSLGMSYQAWLGLHTVFSFVLLVTSVLIGIFFGLKWYEYIYNGKFRK